MKNQAINTPRAAGEAAQPPTEQLNKSFRSLADLKLWGESLKREIATGRPVWVGQNGYGCSRYAVFNVTRWNRVAGEYTCRFELNGELPANWVRFLRTLAMEDAS